MSQGMKLPKMKDKPPKNYKLIMRYGVKMVK